jgi:hypothetical protein
MVRKCAAAAVLLVALFATGSSGRAQDATPPPLPPPADCSPVGIADASRILGFAVTGPEEGARRGGICFFPSRAISEDGSVSYAIVTNAQLLQRRGYFVALARRCGAVAPSAPRALICAAYVKLALAKDLDAYFEARTGPDASPVPGLNSSAVATADALYLRQPDAVIEVIVSRAGDFDLERSTEVAKLLLARRKP